jgi:hypothetical protein
MDQKDFDAMMSRAVPGWQPQGQAQGAAPTQPVTAADTMPAPAPALSPAPGGLEAAPDAASAEPIGNAEPDYSQPPAAEPGLGDPTALTAITGGALQSVFETKDFLFGNTPKDQQSGFRQNVEHTVEEHSKQSLIDGFAAGVGQFATAMIGLGKFSTLAKGLPWVGAGLKAGVEYAPKIAEAGKAALAGAVAFDPHQERLSNLIQGTPLANPLNAFLAADPNDSAAEGRAKAAMESIGLDAAIIGTFLGAAKVWKYLRNGNQQAASAAVTRMQDARAAHIAEDERPASMPAAETPLAAAPEQQPLADSGKAAEGQEAAAGPSPEEMPSASPEAPLSQGEGIAAQPEAHGANSEGTPQGLTADAGEAGASPLPSIALSTEDTKAVLDGMKADADAMAKHGGWYQAIAAGHTFGRGEGIPYAKLNAERDVDAFMAHVVDVAQEQLDGLKGGAVLSDATVSRTVANMAEMAKTNPDLLLGQIRDAGKDANNLVANMEAGYLVANRMFTDSYALAARIKMGDYSSFVSREAALEELKRRTALAATVYGSARSITAASGRAMRRMRMDFRIDPAQLENLQAMDGDQLAGILLASEGDPRNMAKALNPSWWRKGMDFGQFLLVNNLVSGPKTQLINLLSNSYMVGARPLERIIGSSVGAASGNKADQAVFKEALKQYSYLGSAFVEGFGLARKAFMQNDSVLAPHHTEAYGSNRAVEAFGGMKPWTSPGNLMGNALRIAGAGIGLPTRALGFVDEAVKQTVYRSKLMARAHVEALEAGTKAGLEGDQLDAFVRTFVRDKVEAGFDEHGRATDPEALREAQTATFQQELRPGSLGKWVQQGTQAFYPLRLMLPFVKTPTNIMRYGWKMTPILNMAQTEYWDALMGRLGAEAKAQAAGQMTLGGLYMGAAAFLVSNGTITGGGPRDYKQAQELKATGWQPYSVVIPHADGTKTYVPFNRLDPVAIPIGIIADLSDALHVMGGEETPDIGAAIGALRVALSKQFTDKTYLTGASQALDAMLDPEGGLGRWAGSTVANFVPYSALLRQVNPDPYMHEARTITDRVMATIPGISDKVPPKRDAYGDPIRRVGLWSSDEDQLVDHETQRLILESGSSILPPNPNHNGIDLRDVAMEGTKKHPEWAGKSAFEVYQTLAGKPSPGTPSLKSTVARMMQSKSYQMAPDGDIDTRGTKLWLLHDPVEKYREAAMKLLKSDRAVRDAFRAEDLKVRAQWKANAAKQKGATLEHLGAAFGQNLSGLDHGPDSAIGSQPSHATVPQSKE